MQLWRCITRTLFTLKTAFSNFFSTQVKRMTKQYSDITCYAETLPEVRHTNNTLNKSTVCLYSIVKQSQTRKEPLWRQQTAELTLRPAGSPYGAERGQKRYDKITFNGSPSGNVLQRPGTFSQKSPLGLLCRTGDRVPPEARCEVLPLEADRHLQTHTGHLSGALVE